MFSVTSEKNDLKRGVNEYVSLFPQLKTNSACFRAIGILNFSYLTDAVHEFLEFRIKLTELLNSLDEITWPIHS